MGKSEWRNLLAEEYYQQAHTKGEPPLIKTRATVAIHDSMQLLKSLSAKKIKTGTDLVQAFRAAVLEAFRPGSKISTFIFSFDKYPFVPVSKGVEQRSRDKTPSASADAADNQAEDNDNLGQGHKELTLGPLDENWKAHMRDRNYHVPRYIRFIVTNLLTGPPVVRLGLRHGCRVIFDGHYLEDLELFDGLCPMPERVTEFPFLLQRIPIELVGNQVTPNGFEMCLREDLENTIGEGDFSMAFLMAKVAPTEPVIIYSIDSDLVWVIMRFFERFPDHPGIAMFFWPNLSYVVPGKYPDGRARPSGAGPWQRWWDMGLLRDLIRDDPRLAATKNPLRTLEMACIASGGDYVPYLHIPPMHWVKALFRAPEKFADLCRDNNTVSFQAYRELVRGAFSTAKLDTMPNIIVLRNAFDNIVHYLDMLDQVARPEGVLYEQNPMFFGYKRIDTTQPLTRDNIERKDGDSTSDAARLLPEHDRTHYGLWPEYPPRTSPLPAARARTAGVTYSDAEEEEGDESADESQSLGDEDTSPGSASDEDDDDSDTVIVDVSSSEEEDAISDVSSDSESDSVLHTAFGVVKSSLSSSRAASASASAAAPSTARELTVTVSLGDQSSRTATLQLPADWPAEAGAREEVEEQVERRAKRHHRELARELINSSKRPVKKRARKA